MFDCNSFLRRKGWSQKDLARRLNLSTSTVGMWCLGKNTPSYSILVELFYLGMTPTEMFGEEIAKNFKIDDPSTDDFDKRVISALSRYLSKVY